jgi:hypothetical protein
VHAVGSALIAVSVGVLTAAVIAVGASSAHDWCAGWFWGLSLPSGLGAFIGGYMLTTPWHGGRFLPLTQRERATTASLQIARLVTHKVLSNRVVFQIGLLNDGPVDVVVHVNVLVPDDAAFVGISDIHGTDPVVPSTNPSSESVPGAEPQESIYWDSGTSGIGVPAGLAVPLYISVGMGTPRRFPVLVKVFSAQLKAPLGFLAEVGPEVQAP